MVGRLGALERLVCRRASARAGAGYRQAAGARGRPRLLRPEASMTGTRPGVLAMVALAGTGSARDGRSKPATYGDRSRTRRAYSPRRGTTPVKFPHRRLDR